MVRFGGVSERTIQRVPADQIKSLWYSAEEKRAIQRDIQRSFQSKKSGSKSCLRGLEMAMNAQRRMDMEDKQFDILVLQDNNRATGVTPNKGLKALSQSQSRKDKQRALLQAFDDAAEARRIYKETIKSQAVNKSFQERSLAGKISMTARMICVGKA